MRELTDAVLVLAVFLVLTVIAVGVLEMRNGIVVAQDQGDDFSALALYVGVVGYGLFAAAAGPGFTIFQLLKGGEDSHE